MFTMLFNVLQVWGITFTCTLMSICIFLPDTVLSRCITLVMYLILCGYVTYATNPTVGCKAVANCIATQSGVSWMAEDCRTGIYSLSGYGNVSYTIWPSLVIFGMFSPSNGGTVVMTQGLLNTLTVEEFEAFLYHEVGHMTHRDLQVRYLIRMSLLMVTAGGVYLLNHLGINHWYVGLMFVILCFMFDVSIVVLSFYQEQNADHYAMEHGHNGSLMRMLVKCTPDMNAADLSHPSACNRILHIQKRMLKMEKNLQK